MTNRLSLDPPLASADTWAGRPRQFVVPEQHKAATWAGRPTPLAEHLVLDCLRALKAISPSPYAMDLMDMISRGFLEIPGQTARMRRIAALLEISAEEHAS